ncbi:MAG: GNAT family N-acetyltransferase [Anaerolineae bacterium]|nr:GNAT family N-acetyltransferase [Anaerolineae bacterium]MDW8102317.1 GNAT family N-acetyltransferase [Anaerolineae bacterium]
MGFIRVMRPEKDLAGLADLLEEAFGPDLNQEGREFIHELRFIGKAGPLGGLLFALDSALKGEFRGFVWDEGGKVAGNVSVNRTGWDRWHISNVAVAPPYRSKGIARRLMQAALSYIWDQGGRWVTLQVRDDNPIAISLYRSLGFEELGKVVEMELESTARLPLSSGEKALAFDLSRWKDEYKLAMVSIPPGLLWLERPRPEGFQPLSFNPLLNRLGYLVQGWDLHHVMVLRENSMVATAALWKSLLGKRHKLQFLIHPQARGEVEEALAEGILKPLTKPFRGIAYTKIPAEYQELVQVLERAGFKTTRVLLQMRLDLEYANKEVLSYG